MSEKITEKQRKYILSLSQGRVDGKKLSEMSKKDASVLISDLFHGVKNKSKAPPHPLLVDDDALMRECIDMAQGIWQEKVKEYSEVLSPGGGRGGFREYEFWDLVLRTAQTYFIQMHKQRHRQ